MLLRVLAALPLALVLVLMCETPAASGEAACVPTRVGLFNACADLDTSRVDDLRPNSLADAGVRLVR